MARRMLINGGMSHHHKNHHTKNGKNEGEGNRTADQAYRAGLQAFISEDRVDPAARKAKSYVEHNPTQAERDEMAGKAGPRPIIHRIEELATEGRAMFGRAVTRVKAMIAKRRAH